MPRYSYDINQILSVDEVRKLVETAPDLRAKALISFLWLTAARPAEALETKAKDIAENPDSIEITVVTKKHRQGKFFTKTRTLVFNKKSEEVAFFLRPLLRWKELTLPGDFLFNFAVRTLRQVVYEASKKALGRRISPYLLRHSRISYAAEKGESLTGLMHLKGAASLRSVEPYLHAKKKMLDY